MNLHTNYRSNKPNMYNTRKNPIFKSQPSLISKAKHENLKPQVEWKEDQYNRFLLIHLPGFKREEIRVQLDNAGKLYIKGSRLAAENKCLDVDQSLDVPIDVIADKISGKFEDGLLTLIMPKREITEAKAISKEKTASHEEASKEEEPKQEEKKEESNIDKEGRDENTTEQKTHKKRKLEEEKTEVEQKTEAMQNQPTQKKMSTIAEAMTSFAKDAKSLLTDAMHNQPTNEKEKKSTDADTTLNGLNSEAEAEEMSKNNFRKENSKNMKAKMDEGMVPQEEKKVEQAMEEVKEKDVDKVTAVSSEMKCKKEKRRERMQKLKLKMNEIYRDTPDAIRKRVNKMREEDGWLNSKHIDSAVEKINRNRNLIAVAVMAFSVGLYVSHRLKARSG